MRFQGRVTPTFLSRFSRDVAQCMYFFGVVVACVSTSTPAMASPQCNLTTGAEIGGIGFHSQPAANVSECCAVCFEEGHCAAFTFYSANSTCVLKESVSGFAT